MGIFKKLLGTIESSFTIGIGAAGNKTLFADNGDANPPFLIFDDTANEWQFSEDGTTTQAMGEADVLLEQGSNALTIGTIADGQILARSGSSIVGQTAAAGTENVVQVDLAGSGGNGTTDSTAVKPDGAVITKVVVDVTTVFDAGTLQVDINGSSPVTVSATTDSDLLTVNAYETSTYDQIGATGTGVVRCTLAGGPSSGAASVFVHYAEPAV
jgi:hypothetical protein